jgi:uncharacterized glyoxalase superfamily protein PhnB
MVKNPPDRTQRIIPYLAYDDVATSVEFLATAFGLETRLVHRDKDGVIRHAEAGLGDAVVMMGPASPQWGTASPHALPALHCSILVYVDDVNAHFRHARAAGATIDSEPEDKPYGDRMYGARDREGNQWWFATHVRDVNLDEL